MNLIDKISLLEGLTNMTKQEKIVKGISDSIIEDHLKIGDILPSVNELSQKLGFARETVVKAYKVLKARGIIHSKQGIGYFVSNNDVGQKLKIALILYGFQTFQQDFYNKFRKTLGSQYQIDVFFHHNNLQMYKSILTSTKLNYGKYVVAPIQNPEALAALKELPKEKILIIDRYQYLDEQVSHISQEFEISLSLVFDELKHRILAFKRIILYYRDDADYPIGIYLAFTKFCRENNLTPEVYPEFEENHVKKNSFFFTIGDTDLWLLLKDAKEKNIKLGTEIGILSHNDSPVKEIVEGGITTFSSDFKKMAEKAANSITNKKPIKEIIPCLLIRRQSL